VTAGSLFPFAGHAAPAPVSGVNSVAVATFFLFVGATLVITWWAARRTHSRSDFYAASSRIGGVQNGFAIAGDYMSAASFLGLAGLTFIAGYDVTYFIVGLSVGWAVILLLIAERLRNLGSYTFADVVSIRLARAPIRTLAACGTLAVAVPYLIAQLVAAGTLVEGLFGLNYIKGVVVVGVLMTLYVSVGGMIATTWVQIVKAVLLLIGGTLLSIAVLTQFDFNLLALTAAAADKHPSGASLMAPGGLYSSDIISVLSIALAFIGGTAGLPHVLMRFFTVPDAVQARRSAAIALAIVTYFNWIVFIIGLGAVVMLTDHPDFTSGGLKLTGGSNMAAIHLSQFLGGDVFMGFISAVAFATILAVVSGLTLSAAATVSHDLYANVFKHGESTEAGELRVSRAAVFVIAVLGILLAILFEGQNVAVLATVPLAIAASVNFPILFLSIYWRGLTTRGAVVGGYFGLTVAVVLVILGPHVWVKALGFEHAIFPYTYPTLFSMPAGFAFAYIFSILDSSERAKRERSVFDEQTLRSEVGSRILNV